MLNLVGHANYRCGFFWLKDNKLEYEQVPIDSLVELIKTEAAGNGGTIELAVLGACETEKMGRALRKAGVPHVVCWRSEVQDATAKHFVICFYQCLDQQDVAHRDYALAFKQAVARMKSGEGATRAGAKHLAAGAVDYVCFLSESGDQFPPTGRILGLEDSDSSGNNDRRNMRVPTGKEDWSALAGQQELRVLTCLGFDTSPMSTGQGCDDRGFIRPAVLQLWGVRNYTHLWGGHGEVARRARHAPHAKVTDAIACLDKAINFRQEDMKKHAQTRRCRGQCPASAGCRDCRSRGAHEFMRNLMCESKEAMESHVSGAMDLA